MYEIPGYQNGAALNPLSNMPGLGFNTSLDQIQGRMSDGPLLQLLENA